MGFEVVPIPFHDSTELLIHRYSTCCESNDAKLPAWVRSASLQLAQRTENSGFVSSSPSFWDWEKGEKLDYFHNGNPRYTRITAMEYLNGQDCSLLLTATGRAPSAPFAPFQCR